MVLSRPRLLLEDCESRSLDAHLSLCDGLTHVDHLDFAYLAISLLGIGAAGAHCLCILDDDLVYNFLTRIIFTEVETVETSTKRLQPLNIYNFLRLITVKYC